MEFQFDNEKPIYLQIKEKLKEEMINGHYQKDEKLPSVRELATTLKVNPNTVQRAFNELEQEGWIYTKRTSGKYVALDEQNHIVMKEQMLEKITTEYLLKVKGLGYSYKKIIEYIEKKEDQK